MKIKKLLSLIAASAMAVTALTGSLSISALAADANQVVDSGPAGENVTYKIYGDGRLVISGTGPMYEDATAYTWGWNDSSKSAWGDYPISGPIAGVTEVIIEEGVTTVGERAFFMGCYNLKKISLPSTLKKIEISAFKGATDVTEIKGLDSITGGLEIEPYAFQCNIETLKIPDNAILNSCAFTNNHSLKTVIFGNNITFNPLSKISNISLGHFYHCPALEDIYIYDRELSEDDIYEAGNEEYQSFDMTNSPTFHVYKGSATEQVLRNKGYILDMENVKDVNLEYLIDFKKLETAIANAETVETKLYTEDSLFALTTAINEAKAVLKNTEASQEEVDGAVKALNSAIAGLKEKPEPPKQDPTKQDTSNPTTKTPGKATRSSEDVKKDKSAAKKAMRQAKITKLKVKSKAKKKINVTWKKVKKAKGYQVQVSTKKNFKKVIFKKDLKKTKLNIKNKKIKSKKTYYVRVRAYATYKNTNNKTVKVYSKWNKKLRKVTVK